MRVEDGGNGEAVDMCVESGGSANVGAREVAFEILDLDQWA
tara:strand:+ start:12712 stop:12834 length:123 start_codon:yes stop_codon:yes gene_type:complete